MKKYDVNYEITFDIIKSLRGKKFDRLVATLDRNESLTSTWDISHGNLTIYKEGYYLELFATRSKFAVFAFDNDGEIEIAERKPHESKLHRLYSDSLHFSDMEIHFLVGDMIQELENESKKKEEENAMKANIENAMTTFKNHLEWLFELYFISDYKRLLDESYGYAQGFESALEFAFDADTVEQFYSVFNMYQINIGALHGTYKADAFNPINGIEFNMDNCRK